jgi:hypothetical protein
MDNLRVLTEDTAGGITIKTYDLAHYRNELGEDDKERVWRALTTITLEHCLPFGEAVLMEYLEDEQTHTFEAAFRDGTMFAFRIQGNDNLVDPDEPEETISTFVCPYGTNVFTPVSRGARNLRGMVEAARPGNVFLGRLSEDVEAHIATMLSGIKKPTAKEQMDELKKQSGHSRVNRKTRRSKGKRRDTKRAKFRNLASRRR